MKNREVEAQTLHRQAMTSAHIVQRVRHKPGIMTGRTRSDTVGDVSTILCTDERQGIKGTYEHMLSDAQSALGDTFLGGCMESEHPNASLDAVRVVSTAKALMFRINCHHHKPGSDLGTGYNVAWVRSLFVYRHESAPFSFGT